MLCCIGGTRKFLERENMETYWDLSEKQRAELSREEVERYLDAELMTKGILKVEPPILDPVPAEPEIDKKSFHQFTFKDPRYSYSSYKPDLVFESAEDARAFFKQVRVWRLRDNYEQPSSVEALVPETLAVVDAVSADDFANHKSVLDARKAILQENTERRNAFDKAAADMTKCLGGVWDDWNGCRAAGREHQKVIDTMDGYITTAGGSTDIAASFLTKAFTELEITEAYKWFDLGCPCAFSVEQEAVEAS